MKPPASSPAERRSALLSIMSSSVLAARDVPAVAAARPVSTVSLRRDAYDSSPPSPAYWCSMTDTGHVNMDFTGRIVEWRGPSPYYFIPVPDEESTDIREVAAIATYGWGVIPVEARIGDIAFATSLFPKDGGYLLPLKDAVRKPQRIQAGDEVSVAMTIRLDF